MNFEEFTKEVKERIKDFLPPEYADAEIEVTETRKLNQSYPALIIRREGEEIAPSINLRALYQTMDRDGMGAALRQAAEIAQMRPDGFELASFLQYETAKDRLFIRISDVETNRELLKEVPHQEVQGLAITYHVLVSFGENEMGSAMITNPMLETFGITPEQLHVDAMENSPRILPPQIRTMEDMLEGLMGFGTARAVPQTFEEQLLSIHLQEAGGMAVLTNNEKVNGAAVLFYPGIMEQIAESQQVNLFILPSSTHEVILVPDNGSLGLKSLEGMVKSINASEVEAKDRLSDTVYHYDFKEHLLEKASDFESRTKGDAADSNDAPKAKQKERGLER